LLFTWSRRPSRSRYRAINCLLKIGKKPRWIFQRLLFLDLDFVVLILGGLQEDQFRAYGGGDFFQFLLAQVFTVKLHIHPGDGDELETGLLFLFADLAAFPVKKSFLP